MTDTMRSPAQELLSAVRIFAVAVVMVTLWCLLRGGE